MITTLIGLGTGTSTAAGFTWWMTHDGPARLCAGMVAVFHSNTERRKDARAVLAATKQHREQRKRLRKSGRDR
ncbi:hypothetical protein [Nocardia stercoris]|uniref:Uncharacterized protein n=1 Tax=Nocardia stercoris TaxID=2483361 RepID=A0A3M2LJU5_9NOCA|nr:hypothetical protein [Nocardia stercoris]RMI35038.1 hypothetical protein EBN03_01510 [Nocardia stercoris]